MALETQAAPRPRIHLEIADEMSEALQRHVVEAWFPRIIDPAGGFFEDFDRRWRRGRSDSRMLEYQARQVRVAARLALAFPHDGRLPEYVQHGFANLRDRMWDRECHGWFWRASVSGEPLESGSKHAHASAYAVQSCALAFEVTRDPAARELGEQALEWWVRHGHDEDHGGFHSWLTREGTVIRTRAEAPQGATLDPLGHEIGLKDVNTLGDWVEALLDFTVNFDSPQARSLLDEFTTIYMDRAITETGEVHYAFHPGWIPQPGLEWYGYGFEAAQRLLYAEAYLPHIPGLRERARKCAVRTLRLAAMQKGGFAYAGQGGAPFSLEGFRAIAPGRSWWVQFDALRVLALYAAGETDGGPFTRRLQRHWEFVKREMFDERFGGVYSSARSDRRLRSRLAGREHWTERKARPWKDASHETAALLEAAAVLRGEPRRQGRKDVLPV